VNRPTKNVSAHPTTIYGGIDRILIASDRRSRDILSIALVALVAWICIRYRVPYFAYFQHTLPFLTFFFVVAFAVLVETFGVLTIPFLAGLLALNSYWHWLAYWPVRFIQYTLSASLAVVVFFVAPTAPI